MYKDVNAPEWIRDVIQNVAGQFRNDDLDIDYNQGRPEAPRR